MTSIARPMSHPLQGKIALVTGGAKGFGLGIAQSLAEAGARVWITGRDQAALDQAARGNALTAIRADVTSPADWDRVLEVITQNAGRLDILVNNAGAMGQPHLLEISESEWDHVLGVNLKGPNRTHQWPHAYGNDPKDGAHNNRRTKLLYTGVFRGEN